MLLRSTDVLARYGGEEFIVLLPMTEPDGCFAVAEAMRARIAQTPVVVDGVEITLTVSIGVSCHVPAHHDDGTALLRDADLALYDAKHGGRNCVRVAHELLPRPAAVVG